MSHTLPERLRESATCHMANDRPTMAANDYEAATALDSRDQLIAEVAKALTDIECIAKIGEPCKPEHPRAVYEWIETCANATLAKIKAAIADKLATHGDQR